MSQSVPARPRPLSVRDTGARGDGTADDSGAIQRALDETEQIAAIPRGMYRLGSTLRIGSGKTILAHPEAVLRLADGAGRDVDSFLLTNVDRDSGNHHIEVNGGIWDGNNQGNHRGPDGDPHAYTGVALNFVSVHHLRLQNLTVRNPDSFSIRIGETRHFTIEHVLFDHSETRPNQDGVHVGGFCEDGYIHDLRALTPNTTNDDMVALNADDNVERALNLGMKRGPIRNVHVDGLAGDSGYTFVRLLSETCPIENIRIRDISGGCRWYAINMNNWAFPLGSGNIRNVDIGNVRVTKAPGAGGAPLVEVNLGVRDLLIQGFQRPLDDPSAAPTLSIANDADNAVQLTTESEAGLQLSRGSVAEPSEGALTELDLPDGTRVQQAITREGGDDRLILPRGGFRRLELNRQTTEGPGRVPEAGESAG